MGSHRQAPVVLQVESPFQPDLVAPKGTRGSLALVGERARREPQRAVQHQAGWAGLQGCRKVLVRVLVMWCSRGWPGLHHSREPVLLDLEAADRFVLAPDS